MPKLSDTQLVILSAAGKRRAKKRGGRVSRGRSAPGTKGLKESPSARKGTKQALLIDLLKRKNGASIDEIVAVTGWQAHSVRGAISGALRKKLGFAISSQKVEGRGRVYHIVGQT